MNVIPRHWINCRGRVVSLLGFTPGSPENVTLCYSALVPQALKYSPASETFYEKKCINTCKAAQA